MLARYLVGNNKYSLKLIRKRNPTPELYDPYIPEKFQMEIHKSEAKYNALIGSPGLGKTVVGAVETARFIKKNHGNGLIILPTFGMAFDVAMRELRKWVPNTVYVPENPSTQTIKLNDGRVIFIRSADYPKSIEGLDQVTFIWIDEPEEISDKVFTMAKERLHRQKSGLSRQDKLRVVITGVADLKKGRSWVKDTIKNGYESELQANTENKDRLFFFRRATIFESNRYTDEEKQQIRDENPLGTWSRNRYEGLYVPDPEFIIYNCLPEVGNSIGVGVHDCDRFIAGVDCGYRDPFVFLLIGIKEINGKQNYIVFNDLRYINQTEKTIVTGIVELLKSYNIKNIEIYHDHDPLQIRNIRDNILLENKDLADNVKIEAKFIPAYKYGKVEKSLHYMRDMFVKSRVIICSTAESLFYDLASYKWKKTGINEEPEHEFSHAPDALRYALYTNNIKYKYDKVYI